MGFPYPKSIEWDKEGNMRIEQFLRGNESVCPQFFEKFNVIKTDVMIFQPIYEKYIDIDKFSSDYVKNSSLKVKEGVGSVFVYNKGSIEKIGEEGYDLRPKIVYEDSIQMSKKLSVKVSKSMIKHAKECIQMLEKMQETEEEKKELHLGITYEQCVMKTMLEGFEKL